MSDELYAAINFAVKEIVIYCGISFLILGIIGGIFNITVFLSLQTFRQNSCALFLTVMSFVNIGQLLTSLLSRILITGFDNNFTDTISFFCKFRNYFLEVCGLISNTCMCLATFDQFLATSLRPRWQQFFNIKRARYICIVSFALWLIHGIPTLIYYNLVDAPETGITSCTITDSNYQSYISYGYLITWTGIVPLCLTVLFGSLAYWNVRQIPYRAVPLVRRELDKQLTSMVLVQVVFNIFYVSPYVAVVFLMNTADSTQLSIYNAYSNLAFAISLMMYYLYFASPFYIYVVVSKRFRQQYIHVFVDILFKCCKKQVVIINQVLPATDTSNQLPVE